MIIPFLFTICFFKITNSIELHINGDAMLSIKAKCVIKDNGIESKIENYWKINEEVGLIKYKQGESTFIRINLLFQKIKNKLIIFI